MNSTKRAKPLSRKPSTIGLSTSSSSYVQSTPNSTFKPIRSITQSKSKSPSPKAASELTKILARNTLRHKTPYREDSTPTLLANELARNVIRKNNLRSVKKLRPRQRPPHKSLRANINRRKMNGNNRLDKLMDPYEMFFIKETCSNNFKYHPGAIEYYKKIGFITHDKNKFNTITSDVKSKLLHENNGPMELLNTKGNLRKKSINCS